MDPSFAPDMMGMVMSTGLASPAVIRKCSSPDEVALPLGATFHALDTGKLLAAPAICAMAAIEAMSMRRIIFNLAPCRRTPAESGAHQRFRRLFAFHFDTDVAYVRIQ